MYNTLKSTSKGTVTSSKCSHNFAITYVLAVNNYIFIHKWIQNVDGEINR